MKKSTRIILITGTFFFTGLLLIISVLIILGFHQIQSPFITKKIVSYVQKTGIRQFSVEKVMITPWKMVEFKGLDLKSDQNNKNNLELHLDYGKIDGNLLSIIFHSRKLIKISGLLHGKPLKDDQSRDLINKMELIVKEITPVKSLHCKGKYFRIVDNQNQFSLTNFTINMNRNDSTGSSIISQSAKVNEYDLQETSGKFLYNSGMILIHSFRGKLFGGTFVTDGKIDLRKNRILEMNCSMNATTIDQYYSKEKKFMGKIKGVADINLRIQDSPMNPDSLTGNGTITATKVTLVNLPVQKALVTAFGFPQLGNIAFDTVNSVFELKPGKPIVNKMNGNGPLLKFKSSGWYKANGTLEQYIEGVFKSEFLETLPNVVSESMHRTSDNGRIFKCKMYGSLNHPKLELSRATLKKAFSGVFDSMKKDIEKALRK